MLNKVSNDSTFKHQLLVPGKKPEGSKLEMSLPPPSDETICTIPLPKGEYLYKLENLKEIAFRDFLEATAGSAKYRRAKQVKKKTTRKINGYLAFKMYYSMEFYQVPLYRASKLFSEAWKSCDHQHVWNSYAYQYNKYEREVSFIDWLHACRKTSEPSKFIFLTPEIMM